MALLPFCRTIGTLPDGDRLSAFIERGMELWHVPGLSIGARRIFLTFSTFEWALPIGGEWSFQ